MKFWKGQPPRRKSRPQPNPFDSFPEYQKLKTAISHNQLKPSESAGFFVYPEDAKKLKLKHPARTATDGLRRFIKELGLERDYRAQKYEHEPGVWVVRVDNVSPIRNTA